jgi:hypothetical protein
MRTKTLLLVAALSAAGVASSVAQTVYSVNIVGYINKTIPAGLSMVANQLNHTPNNGIETVLGTPPGAVTINKFNPGSGNFDLAIYDPPAEGGVGWDNPTAMVLNPGQGVFVDNASGVPWPVTFVGEVQLNSTLIIQSGLQVYSSVLPQAGALTPTLEFPTPLSGLSVYQFNTVTKGYDLTVFDPPSEGGVGWDPAPPTVAIADAFFIDNPSAAFNWTRNFTVGPP